MSDLLSGYTQYLTFMDEIPLFNSESFIANKAKDQKKFYSDFSSTQIFRQFLQNDSKENFPYFFKIENQNRKTINSNTRQSSFIPRTSNLDISKFIHIRSNSNNLIASKNQNEGNIIIDKQNPVGIRHAKNNNEILNEKQQKSKSKLLINIQFLNENFILIFSVLY